MSDSNGKANHFPDETGEEQPFDPAPDHVAELAASCARFVLSKYKVPLDGTSDTLSLVDQYVRDARADLNVKPEALELLTATIGAYLGEVVRRAYGGTWYAIGDYDGWRLDMTRVFLTFNPLGMAREAARGLADPFCDDAHLSEVTGEQGEDAVRLTEVDGLEHDRLGTIRT